MAAEGGALFNAGYLGHGFNWWIGQVSDDSYWRDNISPGKFEGEKYYVPYYYDLYLDGAYDEITEAEEIVFKIDEGDKQKFPELLHIDSLYLFQDEQGFIYCCVEDEDGLTLPI